MARFPVPPRPVIVAMAVLVVGAAYVTLHRSSAVPEPEPIAIATVVPAPTEDPLAPEPELPTQAPLPTPTPTSRPRPEAMLPPMELPKVEFSADGNPAEDGTTLRSESEADYYSHALLWRRMIEDSAIAYKAKPSAENASLMHANVSSVASQITNFFNVPHRFMESDRMLNRGVLLLATEFQAGNKKAAENVRLGRSRGYYGVYQSWNTASQEARLP